MSDAQNAAAIIALFDAAFEQSGVTDLAPLLDRLGIEGAKADSVADRVRQHRSEHLATVRRQRELSALFSSARELAEVRDADAVLTRLVERAREITGCDIAYMSEFDPETHELWVRRTSGSVSVEFQRLRVPPGRGVTSVIIETRAPLWTDHYDDYRLETHDPGIDAAMSAEGIVSLLGVPMLSGDEVLGVLFAAYRRQFDFSAEQIALLGALADHASVVLQTARILRDLRASEDETRSTLVRLTEHMAERDRANTVHEQLVRAVLAGGGFAPVAETLASALQREVTIIDLDERVIASAGSGRAGVRALSAKVRAAITESRASGRCVVIPSATGVQAVAALSAGAQHFGALLLSGGDFELGGVDLRTVERAAQVGALLSLQQDAVAGAEHRLQSELVTDLLDDQPERRADVRRRARRLGVALDDLDSVVFFLIGDGDERSAARTIAPMLGGEALLGSYRGALVGLYASDSVSSAVDDVRAHAAHVLRQPVAAVVKTGSEPIASIGAAGLRTARILTALGIDDLTVTTADLAPYSAVADADPAGLVTFIDETLGAIRRYDEKRSAELITTLRTYVHSGGSPTKTARALRFHTNTVVQRLERLDVILGEDWREDERLFRIGLAVRLDELRESLLRAQTAPARDNTPAAER